MLLRTIIVEDEPLSRLYLSSMLAEHFPDIAVVGLAAAEEEAVSAIGELRPGLVFMDIELQSGTGFGVLHKMDAGTYVVFTTALDHYAISLLRLSGVPYIQKPIDLESLSLALQAAGDRSIQAGHTAALGHLRSTMQNNGVPLSMLITGIGEPVYILLQDIIAIEAAGRESRIRCRSGADLVMQRELKELDDLLKDFGFFRTHIQHIINLDHAGAAPDEGRCAIMMRGDIEVPVSPKKVAELRKRLAA